MIHYLSRRTFNPAVRPTQLIYDWIFSSLILVFFCKKSFNELQPFANILMIRLPFPLILCLEFQTPGILLISLAHQQLVTRYRNHFIYGISQGNPSSTMPCLVTRHRPGEPGDNSTSAENLFKFCRRGSPEYREAVSV